MISTDSYATFAKSLALKAGEICLDGQNSPEALGIEFKSPKDLVTTVDKKVENYLIGEIQKAWPGHGILGEETGEKPCTETMRWILDPIDGTTSFIHNQPFFAISLALEQNGEFILGVVHAPVLGQLFYGEKGKGAFLNDTPIRVSQTRQMAHAVMATGFACIRAGRRDNNLAHFNRIVPELRDVRRFGSAALDLCYTANGSLDGYWEMDLNLYDIAAGVVILQEAGGLVTDFAGGQHYPQKGIACATPLLHPQLIKRLREENKR